MIEGVDVGVVTGVGAGVGEVMDVGTGESPGVVVAPVGPATVGPAVGGETTVTGGIGVWDVGATACAVGITMDSAVASGVSVG